MARNEISPSKDQIEVIEDFKWFLNQDDKDILIVRGGAGVGKTTLIQEFAKEAKSPDLKTNWTIIPLGNWARSAATIQQITNIPAVLINEFIKRTDEAQINNTSFLKYYEELNIRRSRVFGFDIVDEIKSWFTNEDQKENVGQVYVVDEASCIEKDLLRRFLNCIENEANINLANEIENQVKIVFMGDECQLPPYKESESLALNKEYLIKQGYEVHESPYLSYNWRRSDSNKMSAKDELVEKLRTMVIRNQSGEDARLFIMEYLKGMDTKSDEWAKLSLISQDESLVCFDRPNQEEPYFKKDDEFIQLFKNKYEKNKLEILFVSSSTEKLFKYGMNIRNFLYPDNFNQEMPSVGEIIRPTRNGFKEIISNGEEFEVLEIIDDLKFHVVLRAKIVLRKEYIKRNFFERLLLRFDAVFGSGTEEKILNLAVYKKTLAQRLYGTESISQNKDAWRTWEKNYIEKLNYEELKGIQINDVVMAEYGSYSTVHQSQGGEWDVVVLDLSKPNISIDSSRLWYTAASRAKKQLIILGNDEYFV